MRRTLVTPRSCQSTLLSTSNLEVPPDVPDGGKLTDPWTLGIGPAWFLGGWSHSIPPIATQEGSGPTELAGTSASIPTGALAATAFGRLPPPRHWAAPAPCVKHNNGPTYGMTRNLILQGRYEDRYEDRYGRSLDDGGL